MDFFLNSSVNGSWNQWSSWQPCSVTCGRGHRARTRSCSNLAPELNGIDCPGTNISTESCNFHKCKGRYLHLQCFFLKMIPVNFNALVCSPAGRQGVYRSFLQLFLSLDFVRFNSIILVFFVELPKQFTGDVKIIIIIILIEI